uniref:Protein FAM83H-like n=1 Tax=Sinocyclocheilus grahami TaxID=75366 RepID=A0A672KAU1_SINGR
LDYSICLFIEIFCFSGCFPCSTMARRSQSSSLEEYRMAIDALVEEDVEGYYNFLQSANVVDFLSRSEIEHIKSTVQSPQSAGNVPELPYREIDQDGSSDTYWPLHSDLDAPGLDLGWPLQHHSFGGPTEVTMLVNPADPERSSIKEQARQLIKNAHQVIAVVMDIFTDIDIFSDLLDATARHVPVYILLDEQNAHHFVNMVASCKVNLDMIHMMRVRTVAGITYFCRTGKSFKGQVMDRFLLTDCRAVISGNYSFMWSFEKIHRCIAHLFLGELVATFDEEFRILFAQSQPLVVENALVPMPQDNTSSYLGNQFSLKRTQSLRNPRGYLRQPELTGYPFGDRLESILPFRREDPFRMGPDSERGHYDRLNYGMYQTDQHPDSAYPPELEAPGNLNVLSTDDLKSDSEKQYSGGGRYGPQTHKRPAAGHAYACQSSPTQPHPPDHKQLFST